ncbi:MAG: PKD domain-containing protein [Flavobacteriales bacterium]
MKTFLFHFLLLSAIHLHAQSSSIIGNPAINEYTYGVCADAAGSVYFGATTNNDSWIFKRDINNNMLWSKQLNTVAVGYSSDVSYIDIIGDTIFGCGWLKNGTTINGYLLFKLNANTGNPYWIKSEANSKTYPTSMKYANGKYFISGSQMNNSAGYNGKVIAVSSANGSIIWQTPAIGIMFPGFGIDYIDDFYSSTEMVNGKMFITGRSYVNATANNMRSILVGISDVGTIFLTKYLEFNTNTSSDSRFYGISIEYDGPDSLVVLQYGDDNCSSCTDNKASLIKTDLNGNVAWCKQYDINGISLEVGRGLNITPNSYVFYGYANLNQNNSKMFAIKTDKSGVFQLAKLIGLGTGNMGHISGPINCGGSSNYKNNKHYIPGSYFTTNANIRDIAEIVLNENLEDPQGCLTITPATVTTTVFPPYSNVLNMNNPSDLVNFNIIPSPIQCIYTSPCNASVNFSQNSTCDSSVITANVPSINNPIFLWSNGDIGNTTTAYNNDTLFVYVSNPLTCCIVVDTIIPTFSTSNLFVHLPNDTIVCASNTTIFNLTPVVPINSGNLTYQWNNLSQNDSISVNQSGIYWVTISNGCESVSDTINITFQPIPILTSILADTICHLENLNISLNSNVPCSFSWYAINNPLITGETITPSTSANIQDILSNNSTLNQLVTYQVTSNSGSCSSSQNIQITIIPPLIAPTITASGPITFCSGGNVTLTSNASTGNLWSTGESSQSILISSSETVNLVTTINQCSSPSASITILQLNQAPPTATISGGGTFCQGQNISPAIVNFSGIGPWTLSYELNGLAQTPVTSTNPTINLGQAAGNYVLSTVVDQNCTNDLLDSISITINPTPIINVSSTTICEGSSGTLSSAVNTPGGAYLWSPNGETGSSINVSPTTNSQFSVVYTVNNCASLADTGLVTVQPLPLVSFSADTLIGCAPLEVNFTGNTNGDPNSCIWTINNGISLNGCNPTYTFTQPGCYDITLTSALNGCTASTTSNQYICVENNPIAFFSANPTTISPDHSNVHFLNLSSGATTYYWDFGDTQNSIEVNPSHLYQGNEGNFEVTLVASSALGCISSYSLNILYEEDLIFYVPNSFTPDGDQFNQEFIPIFSSGIDPSSYHLSIYDRWGELIFESYNLKVGWDGTYKAFNGLVQDGIYIWKIDFKLKKNDDHRIVSGHVSVIK